MSNYDILSLNILLLFLHILHMFHQAEEYIVQNILNIFLLLPFYFLTVLTQGMNKLLYENYKLYGLYFQMQLMVGTDKNRILPRIAGLSRVMRKISHI